MPPLSRGGPRGAILHRITGDLDMRKAKRMIQEWGKGNKRRVLKTLTQNGYGLDVELLTYMLDLQFKANKEMLMALASSAGLR